MPDDYASSSYYYCYYYSSCRYKLLLTELLKHTPKDHQDYQDLTQAVNVVSEVQCQ